MLSFFMQAKDVGKLVLPDSVQKANLADTVGKLMNMDYSVLLSDLLSGIMWVVVKIFIALVLYFIGRYIIRRIVRILDLAFEHRNIDPSLRKFLHNMIKVIFSIVLILIVIQTLGVNITSIIALFASATLAIGMALSGTAQNFAGGVMILLMKPYRVGDYISAQGQSGTVKEILLFSTLIETPDKQTIYIPNNTIATSIIDNYSTSEVRRVDWKFGISYGDDVDVARQTILEILAADERVHKEPEAAVMLLSLGDSSINLVVWAWVDNADYWHVFYDNNEKFYKILPTKGVRFPFPQMDICIKKDSD